MAAPTPARSVEAPLDYRIANSTPARAHTRPPDPIMHDQTKLLYIDTVGCQMNVLDSELVVGSLRRQGYELVHEPTAADVILFTTCSVREHAEEKTYSALGRLARHKKQHPETVIGV